MSGRGLGGGGGVKGEWEGFSRVYTILVNRERWGLSSILFCQKRSVMNCNCIDNIMKITIDHH